MSTDIAIYRATPEERWRYSQALAEASLLPEAYRRQPSNVLLALESGAALNVAPMVALQEIHVIKGKPSPSAQLMAALVRRAGHRLRIMGDTQSATCEIVRTDDPDFTFTTTWTLDRAKDAGLLSNDMWRKYPANMLKARAISECCRDACPDVVVGFGYTPEELGDPTDSAGAVVTVERDDAPTQTGSGDGALAARSSGDAKADASGSTPSEPSAAPESPVIEDAVVVDDPEPAGAVAAEGAAPAPSDEQRRRARARLNNPDGPPSVEAKGMMFALLKTPNGKARPRDEALAIVSSIVGREVASRNDLTALDVSLCIDALQKAGAA